MKKYAPIKPLTKMQVDTLYAITRNIKMTTTPRTLRTLIDAGIITEDLRLTAAGLYFADRMGWLK